MVEQSVCDWRKCTVKVPDVGGQEPPRSRRFSLGVFTPAALLLFNRKLTCFRSKYIGEASAAAEVNDRRRCDADSRREPIRTLAHLERHRRRSGGPRGREREQPASPQQPGNARPDETMAP